MKHLKTFESFGSSGLVPITEEEFVELKEDWSFTPIDPNCIFQIYNKISNDFVILPNPSKTHPSILKNQMWYNFRLKSPDWLGKTAHFEFIFSKYQHNKIAINDKGDELGKIKRPIYLMKFEFGEKPPKSLPKVITLQHFSFDEQYFGMFVEDPMILMDYLKNNYCNLPKSNPYTMNIFPN